MKFRFLLVRSPVRMINNCNIAKLNDNDKFKPIKVSRFTFKNLVKGQRIDHHLQFLGLSLPTYRTKLRLVDHKLEVITYDIFSNRLFFIPAQILLCISLFFLFVNAMLHFSGAINSFEGDFSKFFIVTISALFSFFISIIVMKFIFQFVARKNFRIIHQEIEAWLRT